MISTAYLRLSGLTGLPHPTSLPRHGAPMKIARALLLPLLLASTPAFAQFVPGTPYVRSSQSITYAPCASPTVLDTDVDDGDFPITIPFQFRYYDESPTSLTVGAN